MKERTLKSWPFDPVDSITPLEIGGELAQEILNKLILCRLLERIGESYPR